MTLPPLSATAGTKGKTTSSSPTRYNREIEVLEHFLSFTFFQITSPSQPEKKKRATVKPVPTNRPRYGGKEPKRRAARDKVEDKVEEDAEEESDSDWEDLDEEDQKVLKILNIEAKNRKKTKVEKVFTQILLK